MMMYLVAIFFMITKVKEKCLSSHWKSDISLAK